IAPDLVLMDIQLAGEKTGLDVVRVLRGRGVTIPIIAVTAYAMVGDRERCIEAGCDDYMAKPLAIPRLLELFQTYGTKSDKPAKSSDKAPIMHDVDTSHLNTQPIPSPEELAKATQDTTEVSEATATVDETQAKINHETGTDADTSGDDNTGEAKADQVSSKEAVDDAVDSQATPQTAEVTATVDETQAKINHETDTDADTSGDDDTITGTLNETMPINTDDLFYKTRKIDDIVLTEEEQKRATQTVDTTSSKEPTSSPSPTTNTDDIDTQPNKDKDATQIH
ncbi:MAG: response regulator, partial [Chloroflexota bacterium]